MHKVSIEVLNLYDKFKERSAKVDKSTAIRRGRIFNIKPRICNRYDNVKSAFEAFGNLKIVSSLFAAFCIPDYEPPSRLGEWSCSGTVTQAYNRLLESVRPPARPSDPCSMTEVGNSSL